MTQTKTLGLPPGAGWRLWMETDPVTVGCHKMPVEIWSHDHRDDTQPTVVVPDELSPFANIYGIWWRPSQKPQDAPNS